MQVTKHKVVAIDYTLADDDGQTIDTSAGAGPLWYLHGEGNLVPGLERALEGRSIGDQLQVAVQPADGYGERNEELRQEIAREQLAELGELEIGMRFRVPDDDGRYMVVTIVDIEEATVTIDANHELAGATLHFDVTVKDVRAATEEEIAHGHAHQTPSDSH